MFDVQDNTFKYLVKFIKTVFLNFTGRIADARCEKRHGSQSFGMF